MKRDGGLDLKTMAQIPQTDMEANDFQDVSPDAVLKQLLQGATNPLESINNLAYLIQRTADDSASITRLTKLMQSELARLNEAIRTGLRYQEQQKHP
jgi:hypothetical protein